MAITDLDIKGRVGDVTFYKRGDKTIIRLNEGISRHQIKYMPNMINNRLNRREFVACSKTASTIYNSFNKILIEISLKYKKSKNNLVKSLRETQQKQKQKLGKRTVKFSFDQSNFNFTNILFDYIVNVEIAGGYGGGTITTDIPKFDANEKLISPTEATHYRFIIPLLKTKDVTFNENLKNYNNIEIIDKQIKFGQLQKTTEETNEETIEFAYTETTGTLIQIIGIAFYKLEEAEYTNLYTSNAAKIINIINL